MYTVKKSVHLHCQIKNNIKKLYKKIKCYHLCYFYTKEKQQSGIVFWRLSALEEVSATLEENNL
jgi:hypothetical protein